MVQRFTSVLLISLLCASLVAALPGTRLSDAPVLRTAQATIATTATGLQPVVTESGQISWSIDGAGYYLSANTIRVEKPAGATVRSAYLMAASAGFLDYRLSSSDISLAGTPVSWDREVPSSIMSYNYFTDVTSIVKPIVDAAAPGQITLPLSEAAPLFVEGESLVVIFDDPSETYNTIVLAFGSQNVAGDSFNIAFADPIDTSAPEFALDMSLGIAYSFQQGESQYSTVDVNGNRLTSSAGGNDDGDYANGALMTVGGIGDSVANPADPNHTPDSTGDDTFYDDELYDLGPYVQDGDTAVLVTTNNPSGDDDIFFAGFFVGGAAAVVGEGIVLSPSGGVADTGTSYALTATVQKDDGTPLSGKQVTFEIVSGPNAGLAQVALTDANGQAVLSWSSSIVGMDEVRALFVDSKGNTQESNHAAVSWQLPATPDPTLTALISAKAFVGSNEHFLLARIEAMCDNADTATGQLSVVQKKTTATSPVELVCDGTWRNYPVLLEPRGVFHKGVAQAQASIQACNSRTCVPVELQREVTVEKAVKHLDDRIEALAE